MTRPVWFALLFVGACDPDLGAVCDEDPALINELFDLQGTENVIVTDVRFDCESALCLQQGGGEPFCTRRCESDLDCDAPNFTCTSAISFGREGCFDFQANPDCVDDDGTPSDVPIRHCARSP